MRSCRCSVVCSCLGDWQLAKVAVTPGLTYDEGSATKLGTVCSDSALVFETLSRELVEHE